MYLCVVCVCVCLFVGCISKLHKVMKLVWTSEFTLHLRLITGGLEFRVGVESIYEIYTKFMQYIQKAG